MTITASLEKERGGKIGLKLTSENGKLWVTKIAEGGAMDRAKTALEVGMEVLQINGKDVVGMASTDAAKMMLETSGTLSIVARHPPGAFVTGTFFKDAPTTKVGLRLEDGDDRVMINSIREGTLAATTDLGGGMAIRLINNVDCVGKDAMFVAQLLADAVGNLTVVAETADAGELADKDLISATVTKREGMKLGLTLTEVDDKLIVTKIKEGGLMSTTTLKTGMEIYSINNIPVQGMSSSDAARVLIDAQGTLTILAFSEQDDASKATMTTAASAATAAAVAAPKDPVDAAAKAAAAGREIVVVTVDKKPGAKLGLTLSELDDRLVVTKIKEGGLVAGTALESGMEIYSINGIKVEGKTSAEAAGILVEADGTLTIVAFKGTVAGDDVAAKVAASGAAVAAAAGTAAAAAGGADDSAAIAAAANGREVVTVTVEKKPGAKLGLTLSEVDDTLLVTKIKDGGLVAGTELEAGMEIFSINGIQVAGKTSTEAAGILVEASGMLTIVAFKGEVDGDQEEEASNLGKAAAVAAGAGAAAAVASAAKDEDAGDDAATVAAAANGREIVTVTVEKKPGAKLGLNLSDVDGKLMVVRIKDGGLVSSTELEAGMEIYSINGTHVAGKSSTEAAGILVEASGMLTIVAFKEATAEDSESNNLAKAAVAGAAVAATAGTAAAVASAAKDDAGDDAAAVAAAANGREVVTVVVEKAPGAKLGLNLSDANGKLMVVRIKEGGLVAGTELVSGMEIYSINGIHVAGKSSTEAANILVEASGTLTIVAFKEAAEEEESSNLAKAAVAGAAVVAGAGTAAAVAAKDDARDAAAVAAAANGREVVTVVVDKAPGAKLGLNLSDVDGKLMVVRIKDGGLVAGTELESGMEIYSINDILVAGKSSTEAAGILVEASGKLTIVAFKEATEEESKSNNLAKAAVAGAAVAAGAGTAAAVANAAKDDGGVDDAAVAAAANGREVVTVVVDKAPGAKLGLNLSDVDGKLMVVRIKDGGLVAGTELESGMEIYSINGILVAGKSSTEAAGILVEASGKLTIVAFKEATEEESKSNNLAKAAVAGAAVAAGAGTAAAVASAAKDDGGYDETAVAAAANGHEVVTVTVDKQPGVKLGLTLSEVENALLVTKIRDGGLVAGTALEAGMEIYSINGINVSGKSSTEAAGILVEASGRLTIVAFKEASEQGESNNLAKAAVAGATAAAAAGTAAAILGNDGDDEDAAAIAEAANGREVVTVTLQKEPGAKLGLNLSEVDDKLIVTRIKEGGLVSGSALEAGMEIYSINEVLVAGKSSTYAAGILVESSGTLTIVAFKEAGAQEEESKSNSLGKAALAGAAVGAATAGTAAAIASATKGGEAAGEAGATGAVALAAAGREVVTVTVDKQPGAKLGLTLSEVEDKLVVTKVKEGGLVAGTDLEGGMEIYSINGILVEGKSSTEAAGILVETSGELTIVAFKGEIDEEAQSNNLAKTAVAGAAVAATAGGTAAVVKAAKDGDVPDEVPVSAIAAAAAGREIVTINVEKKPGMKLGLTLSEVDDKLIVTKVKEGGLVATTELEAGMEIYSINGILVEGKSSAEAAGILVDASGMLTIIAFKGEVDEESKSNLGKAVVAGAALAATAGAAAAIATAAKGGGGGAEASAANVPADEDEGEEIPNEEESEREINVSRSVGAVAGAAAVGAAAGMAAIPRSASLRSTLPIGTLTTAVIKKSPGERIGFRLGILNDKCVVSGIGEGSLASQTDIQAGMSLLLINNKSCVGKDTSDVAKMLAEAGDTIVIVAESPGPDPAPANLVTAVVFKEQGSKVGVTLTQQGGRLVITKIKEDGLLAETDLKVGMEVLSIDNEMCIGKSSAEAAQLFKQVEGTLMILARKPALAAGALVTAALSRDDPTAKLGIRLGMANGIVVVTGIADGSLAAMTDMEAGMAVRTINNVDVAGLESTDAARLLKDAEGVITILAETRTPGSKSGAEISSLVAASVINGDGANLGLTLSQVDRKLVISKIDEDGLFFGTSLRVGMQVLKINNVDTAVLTQEAAELLMEKKGTVTVLARRTPMQAGSLLTAVLHKPTADTKVGLGLGVVNGMIVVTKIRDGTLGSTTDLRKGMVVRTVNNVSCEGKDSLGVAKLLSEAVGAVTIVAEAVGGSKADKPPKYFTATVEKEKGAKVGLALTQKGTALLVTKIVEDGLLAGTGLEVGMEVVSINNIDCTQKTNAEAAEILRDTDGTLTILVKKPALAPGTLVTAAITKDSPDTKVGLKLGMAGGAIVVAGIGEDSLAAETDLEPGMHVKSINNTDCTGLDVAGAANLLIEADGILTILAEVPKGRVGGAGAAVIASLITATAQKEKEVPAGVVVERKQGKLLVTEIQQDGALFGTGLRVGMQVITINNVDCAMLTTTSANELLKREGSLTILAKPVSLPPGTLITAAFTKESEDMKVGLRLGVSNGVVVITKVADGTLAATTGLETGMVIRAINNIDCTKRTSEMAGKILKEAVGTVTVLAEKPMGTGVNLALPVSSLFAVTFKKEKGQKVGVTLTNEDGILQLGSIGPDSLVANTRLRVGMEILKINNVDCTGMSPTEAAGLLSQCEGTVTVLAKKASSPPGSIITATFTKETMDSKVGLGLGTVKGAIVITNIKDDAPVSDTDLEVGMVLRTINNVDCGEIEATEAARLLKESEGTVTIVAEAPSTGYAPSFDSLVTATVEKDMGEKIGLTVASKGDKIYISKIKPEGLISTTELAVGMELLSINNTGCAGLDSAQVAKLLSETQGTLTLLARKAALPPGSFVTALVTKDSPDTKVGLRLGLAGGVIVISSIAEDSLASQTDLQPGMIIRTINNVDCTGMNPPDAATLLMEADGTISFLAETPSAPGVAADAPALSSFVTVSVNSIAGSAIGLKLIRDQGKLQVAEIQEDGLIVGSPLRVGMEVLKINNVDCGMLTADAATKLMTSEETLTILARKPVLEPGTLVTAVLNKETQDTKVGLRMGYSQGMVVVTGVTDGSLASMTPLESGMVVRSINNVDVSNKNSMDAAKILSGSVGLSTILAEVPSKASVSSLVPSLVTASVDMAEETETGLTFADEDNEVVVASISKNGPWAKTRLRVGMTLKMINTMSCEGRTASDLEAFVQDCEGKVTILAEIKPLAPGTLVTAVMVKESADVKVGLGIGMIGGKVFITNIKNNTIASPTDLRSGLQLRLINNVDCSEMDSSEVGKLLADAEGLLTIVAEKPKAKQDPQDDVVPITATVFKEQDDKVGLALTDKAGKVYITKIHEGGLMSSTSLIVGMEILSINNVQCTGKTAPDCAMLLKETEGDLTILARTPVLPPGSFVTAVIDKEFAGTKVGLRLGDNAGKIVITGITANSLASLTPLEKGMTIKSIDNIDCTGLATADAAKLLVDGEGAITILAATPEKAQWSPDSISMASICAVSIEKTAGAELGMRVTRSGGYLVVSEIFEDGLIFGTALRVGMEILKINNTDCSVLSAESGMALMNTEGFITILARKRDLPPGYLITAVIAKGSPDVKVGLGMGSKNGMIYVTKIRDGTLASRTELQPGMIVRTIDNIDLAGMSLVDAANLLANAEGTVTVAAEVPSEESAERSPTLVIASVKTSKDEKVGLALAERRGELFVSQIHEGGLFKETALGVGMQVLTINNISCADKSVQDAAALLRGAEGDLTILAKKPELTPGALVTASITKETVDTKIGLRVAAVGGVIMVKAITDGSLASKTDLKPGMVVKSINNESTQGKDAVSAAKLLTEASGTITVVAETPSEGPVSPPASTLVTVTVNMDTESKAGMAVNKKNGRTVVARIDVDGLLYGSGLRVGMEILKINNVDCAVLTPRSASALMETEGMLTILARKTLKRAGILVAATFRKPTADVKAGLGLGKSKGRVIVTKIADGTPASMTEIQRGMVVRQINNVPIGGMESVEAAKMIGAAVGLVTLLLETPGADESLGTESLIKSLATASVDRDQTGELGLSLVNKNNSLIVSKVTEDGMFATSGLRAGMAMLSVNNLNVSRRPAPDVLDMIVEANGIMTILTQKPFLGPGEIVTAPIKREDPSQAIGLGLGSSAKTGKVVITSVKEGSRAWFTELYPGMAVKSINNQDLKGKSPEDCARLLTEASGMFTVAAESMLDFDASLLQKRKSQAKPATITATVTKEKGGKVGLLLGEKGSQLFVSKIVPGGLMSETDLKVGMQVLSVNNVECANLPVSEAAKILMEAEGDVTILAKQPELSPGALVTVSIDKEKPETPLGVGLGVLNNKVVISSIKYGSLASQTELQVGMAVKAVSNVDCSRKDPKEVAKLFADAAGSVLILAEVPYPPSRSVASTSGGSTRRVYDNSARPPPYGLTEGGVWTKRKYVGETTTLYTVVGCACFVVPGIYSLLNPVDVRDVYILDGKAYTADGECIGVASAQT